MKPNEKSDRESGTGRPSWPNPQKIQNPVTGPEAKNVPTPRADASEETVAIIARFQERRKDTPPRVKISKVDRKILAVETNGKDKSLTWAKMLEATGTVDELLISRLLSQASGPFFKNEESTAIENLNCALAILYGIKPMDELEGMLAVQMIGTHNVAMEMLRRAVLEDQTRDGVTENVNRATKLLRTFTAQIETLSRYRNKGQQKVTVEHVNVGAGGQAIVGVIENQPGGGVTREKK